MIINKIDNLDDFFTVVDQCTGQVHVVSPEGDDIVLNSKISRIVLALVPKDELRDLQLEIRCENEEDTMRIVNYLMRG